MTQAGTTKYYIQEENLTPRHKLVLQALRKDKGNIDADLSNLETGNGTRKTVIDRVKQKRVEFEECYTQYRNVLPTRFVTDIDKYLKETDFEPPLKVKAASTQQTLDF